MVSRSYLCPSMRHVAARLGSGISGVAHMQEKCTGSNQVSLASRLKAYNILPPSPTSLCSLSISLRAKAAASPGACLPDAMSLANAACILLVNSSLVISAFTEFCWPLSRLAFCDEEAGSCICIVSSAVALLVGWNSVVSGGCSVEQLPVAVGRFPSSPRLIFHSVDPVSRPAQIKHSFLTPRCTQAHL